MSGGGASAGGATADPTPIGTDVIVAITFSAPVSTYTAAYKASMAADIAVALGISPSRVVISEVVASTSTSPSVPATGSRVTITIAPSTSAADKTPAQSLAALKTQLATPNSPIFQQATTSGADSTSLTVEADGTGNAAATNGVSVFVSAVLAVIAVAFATIL